jgi:hypothetical protein
MPRKEFEAFTRLDASDVNTYLMDQSVMSFAGTAARGSAIATPIEGMLTFLEDTDKYEYYTGSSWSPLTIPSGLSLLGTTSFSGASSVNLTNVLTNTYSRYRIMINAVSATGSPQLQMRFRENTTDVTSGYFGGLSEINYLGTTTGVGTNNQSVLVICRDLAVGAEIGSVVSLDLYRTATAGIVTGTGYNRNETANYHMGGERTAMTNFTGLSFFCDSSTMSGVVKLYGYTES